jgi:NAD(P)-dependent dehydrogenase (short-subunit alcohol dehydrogenase family)
MSARHPAAASLATKKSARALIFAGRARDVSIKGTPGFSVHSASKAAVSNFARSWTLDLKSRGIRVNVISPGPVKTPGLVDLAGPDAAQQQGNSDTCAIHPCAEESWFKEDSVSYASALNG